MTLVRYPAAGGGGGAGDVTGAENLGTGQGLFFQKTGSSLQFKSVIAGNNISLSSNDDELTIDAEDGEVTSAANIGAAGEGVFASEVGDELQFKNIKAGSNITVTADADEITITGEDGEATTASNLGATGEGIFASEVGDDLRFKKIKAGTNVSLSSDSDSITIDATGGLTPGDNIPIDADANSYFDTVDNGYTLYLNSVAVQTLSTTLSAWTIPQTGPIAVAAKTNGVGSPYSVLSTESGYTFTNEGASAKVYLSLPTAVAGYTYSFYCQDVDGLRVTAASGDTIRLDNAVSAAAGYIETSTIGAFFTMRAVNATEWVCYASTAVYNIT